MTRTVRPLDDNIISRHNINHNKNNYNNNQHNQNFSTANNSNNKNIINNNNKNDTVIVVDIDRNLEGYATGPSLSGKAGLTKLPEPCSHNSGFSYLLEYFRETTTMHVLPHMFDKRLNCFRVLWLIVLICATTVLGYHGAILISRYVMRPVQVAIQMEYRDQTRFPAVTVCNLNPVKASMLNQSEVWRNIVQMQERFDCDLIENATDDDLWWLNNETRHICSAQKLICEKEKNENLPIRPVENFAKIAKESTTSDLADVTWLLKFTLQDLAKFNVISETLIKECSFDRTTCPNGSISTFLSLKYGKCETFNSALASKDILSTRRSGAKSGVRMTLNIYRDEYVGMLARTYGARVVVHWPYDKPHPHASGFNVSPGIKTSVALRRKRLTRLKYPFTSNCSESFSYPDPSWQSVGYRSPGYTYVYCRFACIQAHMLSACGCVEDSAVFLVNGSDTLNKVLNDQKAAVRRQSSRRERICNMTNMDDYNCQKSIYARIAAQNGMDKIVCSDCNSPCEENIYTRSLSLSEWPTSQFAVAKIHGFLEKT